MAATKRSFSYTLSGTSLVFLSAFFYGTYGIWNRLLGPHVGAFSQGALRSLLIVIILVPLLLRAQKFYLPSLHRDGKWLALLAIGGVFSQSAYFMSVNRLGIGLAVTTMFTVYVILMMLWGCFYDKLPFTSANVVSLVLAIVGLTLMFNPLSGAVNVAGLLLAVLSGIAIAATIIGGRNMSGGPYHALFAGWGLCMITNGLIAILLHESQSVLFMPSKLGVVLIYTVVSIAASFTVQYGVRKISAALTGLIGLLENVFAIAFGALFFDERIGLYGLLGATLIIVAIAVPDIQAMLSRNMYVKTTHP